MSSASMGTVTTGPAHPVGEMAGGGVPGGRMAGGRMTVTPDRGLGRALRTATDIWVVALRYLTHWRREPAQVVWGLAFPIMSVLLFGYVFGGSMMVPGGGDYREFLLPGLFAMTMVFGIGNTMVGVTSDSEQGINDRFRSMPMAQAAVVVGRSVADMLNSMIDLGLMVVCGLVVGWRWHGSLGEALLAVVLLLLLRFAFLWVGTFFGLGMKNVEAANNAYSLLFPVAMIANTFASPTEMPAWLGTIAEWNPLSATAAATRDLFGSPGADAGSSWVTENALLMAVVWPLLLVAVFLPLAVRRYQKLRR